jgi:hypothetical protein
LRPPLPRARGGGWLLFYAALCCAPSTAPRTPSPGSIPPSLCHARRGTETRSALGQSSLDCGVDAALRRRALASRLRELVAAWARSSVNSGTEKTLPAAWNVPPIHQACRADGGDDCDHRLRLQRHTPEIRRPCPRSVATSLQVRCPLHNRMHYPVPLGSRVCLFGPIPPGFCVTRLFNIQF